MSGLPDARGGEVGALRAAARQRRDEAALARARLAPGKAGHIEAPLDRRSAGEPEARELPALHLLGDGVAREEGDPETLARRPLDRLGRVESTRAPATRTRISATSTSSSSSSARTATPPASQQPACARSAVATQPTWSVASKPGRQAACPSATSKNTEPGPTSFRAWVLLNHTTPTPRTTLEP
jgi:hypothetical protein